MYLGDHITRRVLTRVQVSSRRVHRPHVPRKQNATLCVDEVNVGAHHGPWEAGDSHGNMNVYGIWARDSSVDRCTRTNTVYITQLRCIFISSTPHRDVQPAHDSANNCVVANYMCTKGLCSETSSYLEVVFASIWKISRGVRVTEHCALELTHLLRPSIKIIQVQTWNLT